MENKMLEEFLFEKIITPEWIKKNPEETMLLINKLVETNLFMKTNFENLKEIEKQYNERMKDKD